MSSARTNHDHASTEPAQRNEADGQAEHAANAQWLKDNPAAMPQVGAGRWAVYDREGTLCGHLVGDGPTRDTRFKAIVAADEPASPDDVPSGFGITLHDAGAHLLDTAVQGDSV
ncbi:hypothetical protein [Nonomuraea endophytica]|uniref:Uncharacterized protein n=1 Tax=Nonomuraea endophytica TaxID=714136 RepID=A0A7W7ZYZ2_9ACTN|nr:hypothetical protein [Nonomuraea endophytica]MBB5076426.1 hypothetical protein [Nonomuraea endophytica]